MTLREWQNDNNRYDPALILTLVLGIAAATYLALAV
jgi:hypothetical protein